VLRRAASYSDFYRVARAQVGRDVVARKQSTGKSSKRDRTWEALILSVDDSITSAITFDPTQTALDAYESSLLDAGQQEYSYAFPCCVIL
jgi:conserved oligomeric Golgi complex subunit 3